MKQGSVTTGRGRLGLVAALTAAVLLAACDQAQQGASTGAASGVYAGGTARSAALSAAAPTVTYSPETERYPGFTENDWQQVRTTPLSTIAMEVDTAAYSRMRRMIRDGFLPPRDALRLEEMVNYFKYAYPAPRDRSRPFAVNASVLPSPWNADTRLLHVGIKAWEPPAETERPPANLVFLVDVSGSMNANDRLPLVKRSLKVLVRQMREQDRAALVVYAGSARVVLQPLSGRQKNRLLDEIEGLSPGGSTAGGDGLRLAYRLAEEYREPDSVNRVMLFSDGDFNVGPSDSRTVGDLIAAKRKSGVYLSVFTVGTGNLNDRIAQSLAQRGNGIAAYIDGLGEARRLFDDQLRSTLTPVADDVKAQIEFNPEQVAEYRLIGYETRQLSNRDFTDDRVDAGEVGTGHSVTLLYEFRPVGSPPHNRPLRYQSRHVDINERNSAARNTTGRDTAQEFAYLSIRYKLPGQSRADEMSRAIDIADAHESLVGSPQEARFATAVAAFGLVLRHTPDLADYGLDQIAQLAENARGADPNGERAEFLRLIREVETLMQTVNN